MFCAWEGDGWRWEWMIAPAGRCVLEGIERSSASGRMGLCREELWECYGAEAKLSEPYFALIYWRVGAVTMPFRGCQLQSESVSGWPPVQLLRLITWLKRLSHRNIALTSHGPSLPPAALNSICKWQTCHSPYYVFAPSKLFCYLKKKIKKQTSSCFNLYYYHYHHHGSQEH